jgi:ribosomal protein S24E
LKLYTAATLKLKNHVVKVEGNIEDNTMGKIKSTKEQALIYKTQRRALKIEGHLILICSYIQRLQI